MGTQQDNEKTLDAALVDLKTTIVAKLADLEAKLAARDDVDLSDEIASVADLKASVEKG